MRVLLVEDDKQLAEALLTALRNEQFTTHWVNNGREAVLSVKFDHIDIVILDLGLPDIDGLEALHQIKSENPTVQVLILTARDQTSDKVSGLEKGADDYVVKPFELEELIARIRVLERRLGSADQGFIVNRNIKLGVREHTCLLDEQSIELTRKEYLLLKALMEAKGRILTKDSLEAKIYNLGDEVASNALEVHVSHLRQKLGKEQIQTIRGVGYKFNWQDGSSNA